MIGLGIFKMKERIYNFPKKIDYFRSGSWRRGAFYSDKFRLVIGTEAGESRAIDAIEEVLKKLGSVIEEVDHAKYLMYIEHGTDDLMMDELVRIVNCCEDKTGG